jgi:hypothetical protein
MSRHRTGYAIVGTLIAASAVAFVHAEQLKLRRAPVGDTRITKHFSTTCRPSHSCPRSHRAPLRFRLRTPARLRLTLVNAAGRTVRTFTPPGGRRYGRGDVQVRWDGRTDAGRRAPDGRYRLRVELPAQGRTITIHDPVVLDTVPPRLRLVSRPGRTPVRYAVSEHARVFLAVRPLAGGDLRLLRGHRGRVVVPPSLARSPARMTLVAVDLAGNASRAISAGRLG